MSRTELSGHYDSDDEVFEVLFCAVEVTTLKDNELNIKGLEKMFG